MTTTGVVVSFGLVGLLWLGLIGGVVAWSRRRPDETPEQARVRRDAVPRARRQEWAETRTTPRVVIVGGIVLLFVGGVGVRVLEDPTWWGWAALVLALPVLLLGFWLDAADRRRRGAA